MGSIMSIGRSKAKLYSTERPSTTFDDVAGYDGVKLEISEVVDFLKTPARFKEIGARIPKGILLVGPPGTGKTLLARAVAGEAGVPFMSVSGSDFMEMFVGVGASRVRDLFATARKQAPAIVFIDEIDSIGRKRGAGLGGGHDEREQTLNQMLSEMDGFDPTEGIVVMAATNRPDILDAAILRPGRFDRQIVVPAPRPRRAPAHPAGPLQGQAGRPDRRPRQGGPGHAGHERRRPGQPGQRGRPPRRAPGIPGHPERGLRGVTRPGPHGPAPREPRAVRTPRRSGWPSTRAGHAVLAYVLPDADPVHKVTILPTGMALGVTMQLPMEERHIHPRQHIEDSLAVRMGGRAAELLVYGDLSTGAGNDLVGNTELARKMVREWGMSDKIGPMAWGSQGQVFLGEDLMHTRDYSEHTSQIIDDEVEIILRAQEQRALEVLARHRGGLDAVARALLDEETIDGETVGRLVDTAYGRPVHEHGVKTVPPIFVACQHGPTGSDNVDGPPEDADRAKESGANGSGARHPAAPLPVWHRGDPPSRSPPTRTARYPGPPTPATRPGPPDRPSPASTHGDGNVGQAPWPPPPPPTGHWPQAPSPTPRLRRPATGPSRPPGLPRRRRPHGKARRVPRSPGRGASVPALG